MIPVAIHYPENLPVSQRRDEIAELVFEWQVVIVAGETGLGKTTQLPKILLELGKTSIGHTQPRRIADRTIAERVAEELGQEVGEPRRRLGLHVAGRAGVTALARHPHLQWLSWVKYALLFNIVGGVLLVTSPRRVRTKELVAERRKRVPADPAAPRTKR